MYKGALLITRNKDFSVDCTLVNLEKQMDDSMRVHLIGISATNRICDEPILKYQMPASVSARRFEKGKITNQDYSSKSSCGIIVKVTPGVDVLRAAPEFRKHGRNDTISLRITGVGDRIDENSSKRLVLGGAVLITASAADNRIEEDKYEFMPLF